MIGAKVCEFSDSPRGDEGRNSPSILKALILQLILAACMHFTFSSIIYR